MSLQQKTFPVTQVFSDVLANLAFMFTDDELDDHMEADLWLETTISYQGPFNGSLMLRCTRGFSIQLAANLLGIDPHDDDAESKADDAVKEFMNIVCGQFVTASYGTEPVFNLSIPQVRELAEMPNLTAREDDSATLSVDGFRVQLSCRKD